MKALVLAGGSGTRLRPTTYTYAKQLVPLANKPIILYGLEAIAAAGIVEVGVVVGDTQAEFEKVLGGGAELGLRITYVRQEAPLGLAHGVLIARDFLGDEPFVMYLGDNVIVGGIEPFVRRFEGEHANALVLLTPVDVPERFGIAELGVDGELVGLVEKPEHPKSNLALAGVYLFDHHVHEAVRAIEPSARGELEITDAIQWLRAQPGLRVATERLAVPFIDTGKLQDLLEANRIVLGAIALDLAGEVDDDSQMIGPVVVAPGAKIVASTVRGPAVIGPNTRVERSVVGPATSIGPCCEIVDAELEGSVVLEGAHIEGVHGILESLVGRGAVVRRSGAEPDGYRMHIGDHSDVQVP